MADLSDCESAIREAIQATRDLSFPGVAVYRGWPAAAVLDATLKANGSVVTVTSRPNMTRSTTRFPNEAQTLAAVPASFLVSVSGSSATFYGTASPDQIAGVNVANIAYDVRLTAQDTPATVAANLAALVPSATSSGAIFTAPGLVAARTGRDVRTIRPTRTVEQGFAVYGWFADPLQRDAIMGTIDAALSDSPFLSLADGSRMRLIYSGNAESDKAENASLYRRDLYYTGEYSTTISSVATPALWITTTNVTPASPASYVKHIT